MKTSRVGVAVLAVVFAALPVWAQQQKRVSPHEVISQRIDRKLVTIVYGRPYTKDPKSGEPRQIWGKLVPYGKVWRLGSDEATTLLTEAPLEIGGVDVQPGAYSLFMLPEENGASKLIINKQVGQWGLTYHEDQDVGRVDMTKESAEKPTDQLTLAIEKGKNGGGVLRVTWADTSYTVPFTVKK
ncbi:MAG: DUF2911 domain-containing protein [Phycisphaerae bacterium]